MKGIRFLTDSKGFVKASSIELAPMIKFPAVCMVMHRPKGSRLERHCPDPGKSVVVIVNQGVLRVTFTTAVGPQTLDFGDGCACRVALFQDWLAPGSAGRNSGHKSEVMGDLAVVQTVMETETSEGPWFDVEG